MPVEGIPVDLIPDDTISALVNEIAALDSIDKTLAKALNCAFNEVASKNNRQKTARWG